MVGITNKKLSSDTEIIANNNANVPSFKDRLYSLCNQLLPNTNYWDSTTSVPDAISKQYLCSRADLLSEIASILDNDTTVKSDVEIVAKDTYEIIKKIFIQLGRCKKVYVKSVSGTGQQTLPFGLEASVEQVKWAYFKKSFDIRRINSQSENEYTSVASELPPKIDNSNTDVTRYSSDPLGSVGWNNDTTYHLGTQKVSSMSVNELIKAIDDIEAQLNNFQNDSNTVNNRSWMWNGSSSSPNGSNSVTFVKYWCHKNCHSSCHSNGRSRR